jgi:hypothetical protein
MDADPAVSADLVLVALDAPCSHPPLSRRAAAGRVRSSYGSTPERTGARSGDSDSSPARSKNGEDIAKSVVSATDRFLLQLLK